MVDWNAEMLGARIREVREAAGVSQDEARAAIDVSQPTYSRIEAGSRPLKGAELIQLADRFGVRAASIAGIPAVADRARFAARTDGSTSAMEQMRHRLYSYLELDAYLTDHGIGSATA